MILAIDPGSELSAYVLLEDDYKIVEFDKVDNETMLAIVATYDCINTTVIEMIASYGMPVGAEVFETCVWIGRFMQASNCKVERLYRKEVKLHLCSSVKAKDSNIIQALKDRFGDKGIKSMPGFFYGFSKDVWQAMAVAVTYLDRSDDEANRNSQTSIRS